MIQTLVQIQKNNDIATVLQIIKKSKRITFLTHLRPDADGISACAALSTWSEKLGINVETIYPSKSTESMYAHPKNVHINKHSQQPDLLIACDTANYDRLYYPESFKEIPLINIDHHVSNSIKGSYNFVVSDLSSTCELVYWLLQEWDPTIIDTEVASTLLYGILYDSQSFQTSNTSKQTLVTATHLIEHGANMFELNRLLYAQKTVESLQLWGKLLQNMKQSESKQSIWLTLNHEESENGMAGTIHNFVIQNMPVDIVALFSEVSKEETKVSLRSTKTDVNLLAQKFGGGGHKNAAGLLIKKSLKETIALVTKEFT